MTFNLADTNKYFRFEILLIFSILEVLFYDSTSFLLPVIALLEYVFILIVALINFKLAIAYFVSFLLLSMSTWSYVIQDELPNTFWGLRLFGLSFNIFFSFFLLLFGIFKFRINFIKILNSFDLRYFFYFILYTTILGGISIIFSVNYSDNFIKDTGVYLPFFCYLFFLYLIDDEILIKIFKWGFLLTVMTMLLSYICRIYFAYGVGFTFVLMNSFAYLLPFSIFFLKKYFTPMQFYFMLGSILFLLLSGKVFVGGKSVIIYILSFIWFFAINKKFRIFTLLIFCVIAVYSSALSSFWGNQFDKEVLVYYKLSQVFDSFLELDIDLIASSPTSMGNLIAEGKTIVGYFLTHPLLSFFGKGLGGGIPDFYGYFTPLAGPGTGYTYNDILRNDFFRMHLPLYEIVIKGGLLALIGYVFILVKALVKTNIISFMYFIILFTVFFNSKEMMLLTLVFMRLTNIYSNRMFNSVTK